MRTVPSLELLASSLPVRGPALVWVRMERLNRGLERYAFSYAKRQTALRGVMGAYLGQSDPLWRALASIARDEGLLLYDVEKSGDKAIRVFVERPERFVARECESCQSNAPGVVPMRVSSGDCSRLCRRLMVFLSVEGPEFGLDAEPVIDVSSPGINRNLRLAEHFLNAVGERVKVSLYKVARPPETRCCEAGRDGEKRTFSGILSEVREGIITLLDEKTNKPVTLRLDDVERARVDFDFSMGSSSR